MNAALIVPLKHAGLALAIGLGPVSTRPALPAVAATRESINPAGLGAFVLKVAAALRQMALALWLAMGPFPGGWPRPGDTGRRSHRAGAPRGPRTFSKPVAARFRLVTSRGAPRERPARAFRGNRSRDQFNLAEASLMLAQDTIRTWTFPVLSKLDGIAIAIKSASRATLFPSRGCSP